MPLNADHIIVGNDNNLLFFSGRAPGKPDDNEKVILKVGELLRARQARRSAPNSSSGAERSEAKWRDLLMQRPPP